MPEHGIDQAHGLRRMFAPGRPRLIQIVAGSGGVGRTSAAVNLAVALAHSGHDTVLIETVEQPGKARALAYLGLAALQASRSPRQPLEIPATAGLAVWPLELAVCARDAHPAIPIPAQLPGRTQLADCVLVNSACGRTLVWSGELASHDVLIVLSRAPAAITKAYALVKRMSARSMHARFQVLVNRVGSEAEARLIFRNLAAVAQGYLDVRLEFFGFIPADAALTRAAALGSSVLDVEPDAPASRAFRRMAETLSLRSGPALCTAIRTLDTHAAGV